MSFFRELLDTSDFPIRWNCGDWSTGHGWLHILSDLAIAGAYFAIPIGLAVFYFRKRSDLAFPRILILFSLFILCCGLTHLVEATIFWKPWYRLSGVLKLLTAIVSWTTVISILLIARKAMEQPSTRDLSQQLADRIASEAAALRSARESRSQLELILDSSAEGIYGIDRDGICTFSNSACARMLGFSSSEELLGQEVHSLIHHSDLDGRPQPASDCLILFPARTGEPSHISETHFWRTDGTAVPVEVWSYPMTANGKTQGAVVTFLDITERKQSEEKILEALEFAREQQEAAELANRQKTQFLANISHEIRTPMNAILGFSELMGGVVVSEKAKQYLGVIRNSGESLLDLINDLLDLSKIEAGRIDLHLEPTDLSRLVNSVVAIVSPQSQEKNLEISVSIASNLPQALVVDRLRVRQVLLNLLTNAIKFTDSGSVDLAIACKEGGERSDRVNLEITVSDTGCGIPEESLKRIFRPFHQVEGVGEFSKSGTGLGLSISQRLVQLMDGFIDVESHPGVGSTFTVGLPDVKVADASARVANDLLEEESDLNLIQPSRILVADDNEVNRNLMEEMFLNTHHEVFLVENGEEAIAEARKQSPDVILMDIRMPKMGGREALGILREEEELASTPVVAVTASSLLNQEKTLRRAFDGYLRKPFTRAQLFRTLAARLPLVSPEKEKPAEPVEIRQQETDRFSNASADQLEKWVPLLNELIELRSTSWESVSQTMAYNAMKEFARNLQRLGEEYDCPGLAAFGNGLLDHTESFRFNEMERMANEFPDLIPELESAIREEDS